MSNGKLSMEVFIMNTKGLQTSENHARAAFQKE